jgi:hypothetical protein
MLSSLSVGNFTNDIDIIFISRAGESHYEPIWETRLEQTEFFVADRAPLETKYVLWLEKPMNIFIWDFRLFGVVIYQGNTNTLARLNHQRGKDAPCSSWVSEVDSIYRSFCIRKSDRMHPFR